jgi:hypothetical protein
VVIGDAFRIAGRQRTPTSTAALSDVEVAMWTQSACSLGNALAVSLTPAGRNENRSRDRKGATPSDLGFCLGDEGLDPPSSAV